MIKYNGRSFIPTTWPTAVPLIRAIVFMAETGTAFFTRQTTSDFEVGKDTDNPPTTRVNSSFYRFQGVDIDS